MPVSAHLFNFIPEGITQRMQSHQSTSRILYRLVRQQDISIPAGIGKGLRFNSSSSNPEYALGSNELPVQQALSHHLKKGGVLYDIGANVGFFTMLGARLVGPSGYVYAFEPFPPNAMAIRHNQELNDFANIRLLEYAVADYSGTGELMVAAYSGGSALSTVETPPPDFKERMAVNLISIDDLQTDEAVRPPTVMKIDVEGAEMTVLKGMAETLQRHRPIIIYEIDDADETSFVRKQEECADFLEGKQYTITQLEDAYEEINWHVAHFVATPR